MPDHILFLTGKLAEKSLARVLDSLPKRDFSYEIRVLGVSVAALMTGPMIKRRLKDARKFDRVILPGRCRGDLDDLGAHFDTPFERGPEELKDLPTYFGIQARPRDIGPTDVTLFAEIVDAPHLTTEQIVQHAERFRLDGADVIDIGCLPDTPFSHMEEAITTLKQEGFSVSIDSLDDSELKRGIGAGADYAFSLREQTLDLVFEHACIPILIPNATSDSDSLNRAIDKFAKYDRPFFADPIIEPIHHGFTASLLRYKNTRDRYPELSLMIGVGNLSELTHTDSLGLNTLLMGIVSELGITGVLTTEVSPHCRSAIRELDRARRIMFAAREDHTPPRHIDESLLALHDRHPFPYTPQEIAEFATGVTDDNFRIQISGDGIHIYNRHGLHVAQDPYDLFSSLELEGDVPHAFYLGLELARAELAWQLGKRYTQDEPLSWGCVVPRHRQDKLHFPPSKSTLKARKKYRKSR